MLLFLSLVLMFASYVLLSDKIINHHQISRGFVLMYSHIAISISVLLMTVDALYLNNKNVDRKFLYGLIVVTILLYYFSFIVLINMESCLFLSFSNEKQKFFKLTLL